MLLATSTMIAFLVTAAKGCPVEPSNPSENLSLSSLANVNLYRYYDLENKDYNMEFLSNAFKKLDDYPKCTLAKHIALLDTIQLLKEYNYDNDVRTLRSRVEEALEISKNTAVEDIVKFRVAHFLQFNAVFYLNALFAKDNFRRIYTTLPEEAVDIFIEDEKEGHSEKAIRILRKAVTTGDVSMADVKNSFVNLYILFSFFAEDLRRLNTGYDVVSVWDEMLLERKNAIENACKPKADADEQHSVPDQQAHENSSGELSVSDINPIESVNSTVPYFSE